eukprot:CAMPEP_0113546728 /NCGR_PEP_ID=MMETSP0015_2-20120614/11962_1 /TAXON_ID=2838 /ORGANISM="Odontella" /LENGTH=1005 /DNA_ID=CAMNT_0000447205 /DNA_START=125 /DNA_END=3142 /DNA_ORIENTATION=- /assembly_acc=CAM_ASM_000160
MVRSMLTAVRRALARPLSFKLAALGSFAALITSFAHHFVIQSNTSSHDIYYDAPNHKVTSRAGARTNPAHSLLSASSCRDQQYVINAFKGRSVPKDEITMLSHGTVNKLNRMLTQIQLWTGPASIAMYLRSQEEILQFNEFISHNDRDLQNTAFHVYYEEAISPSGEPRFYPYNILRNLAMNQLESDYFFAVDVDLMTPLERGYEKLKLLVQDPEIKGRLHSKTLLVLPAFEEVRGTNDGSDVSELPRTKDELVHRVRSEEGVFLEFWMKQFPPGHAPTNFPRWYEDNCTHSLYDIEYAFKFEPYVIGYKHGIPQYWSQFRYSPHFDKYSWFLEAHHLGFRYAVLCDHYVIHQAHSVGYREEIKTNMIESVFQWRKFKQYLMNKYGATREELRDHYGFLPTKPGHVSFELSSKTVESGVLKDFLNSYRASAKGESTNRARLSDSEKFCFVDNPHCQAVGEMPEVLSAVRSVLDVESESEPSQLFLWGVKLLRGWAGREHSLHTDMEFAGPECGRHSGAVAYIVLERDCNDSSFVRLFSGSHLLDFIADEELARLGCWSEGRSALPCDTEVIMEDIKRQYNVSIPNLEVVDGPRRPYEAVVWPTTSWHMTKDTCARKVLILYYTNNLACAKSLRYKTRGPVLGEHYKHPELYPFQPIGSKNYTLSSRRLRKDYVPNAMDRFRLPKPTLQMLKYAKALKSPDYNAGNCSTYYEDNLQYLQRKVKKAALPIHEDIFISGEYALNELYHPPTGIGKVPKHPWVKSKTLAVNGAVGVYFANRTEKIVHEPHIEITDEVCIGLRGSMNVALSARDDCSQTFDVFSLEKRQIMFIPSGVTHTNSPDSRDDGEVMCFKFFPYKTRTAAESGDVTARTSRFANKGASNLIENWPGAGEEIDLFYFRRGSAVHYEEKGMGFKTLKKNMPTPGYKRLKAKIYHFAAGETYDQHTDSYDLIAFSMNGTIEIMRDGNKPSSLLTKHQYAFVPAQVAHGISASHGSAEILFIEIETESE